VDGILSVGFIMEAWTLHWKAYTKMSNGNCGDSSKFQIDNGQMEYYWRNIIIGWHKLSLYLIQNNGIELHYGSLYRSLQSNYPEYSWQRNRFNQTPSDPYKTIHHQRRFFDRLANQLNITKPEDWYNVNTSSISKKGAGIILQRYYGGYLSEALRHIYPEYKWQPWRFDRIVPGFWSKEENVEWYLDWLASELGIIHRQDWAYVTFDELRKYKGASLLKKYGGIVPLLGKFKTDEVHVR
jgi:hypothetical protein